ncbi:unnamed protein product [Ixodes pacificus]
MRSFDQSCPGLSFTHELPINRCIRFLDLSLKFTSTHVCWMYQARSCKGFLPSDSEHSKTVKRGLATTAIVAALQKSCPHRLERSFQTQISRLQDSGYTSTLLVPVCESICKQVRRKPRETAQPTKKKLPKPLVVLPYVHGVRHRLKKIAGRHGIQVVFSAPNKAYAMCRKVNSEADNNERNTCGTAHRTQYAPCESAVVYNIPLSCGKCYIGQTGRCVNDRTREHAASVRTIAAGGHLPAHCRECQCAPFFSKIAIMARHKKQIAREILESLAIEEKKEDCVSTASIVVHAKEKKYLQETPPV